MSNTVMERNETVALADEVLLEQTLQGDQHAFELFVQRYTPLLSRYLRQMLDEQLVWDVLQHVWVQCYLSLPVLLTRTNVPKTLRPWLFRVARNRGLDEVRRRRRRPELPFSAWEHPGEEEEITSPLHDIVDPHLSPEEAVQQQENCAELFQAIAALPPKLRVVLLLRGCDEQSFEEIGERLNMPTSTAKTYFYRARNRLQRP